MITSEVTKMRKLVSLEILSIEYGLECARREKDFLTDNARAEKGCLDSMWLSLNAHIRHCEEVRKILGVPMFLHPVPCPTRAPRNEGFEVTMLRCEKCLLGFTFNDVIVCSCRHLYHPFCALMHFRATNACAKVDCSKIISPEWAKSFGFREFDAEMLENEVMEGCEDARVQYLVHRCDVALSLCPNISKFLISYLV